MRFPYGIANFQAKADQFEQFFGHLKIGHAPTARHNSYFVMKWNFSLVDPMGDAEAIRGALSGAGRWRRGHQDPVQGR